MLQAFYGWNICSSGKKKKEEETMRTVVNYRLDEIVCILMAAELLFLYSAFIDLTQLCLWFMHRQYAVGWYCYIYVNSYSASRDNWCTVGGYGGCRVGEVRAGTTSPLPDHKGFKLQWLVDFQKFSTLQVKIWLSHPDWLLVSEESFSLSPKLLMILSPWCV